MSKQAVVVETCALLLLGGSLGALPAGGAQSRVVEVPAGPAFVKLPGAS